MPNWVSNRLTLSGPAVDVERFRQACIRVVRNDGEIGLDFDSLKPMPVEIEATIDDRSDVAMREAIAATGFEDWYDWSIANWGAKWNSSSFCSIHRAADVEDIFFCTANGLPGPIMVALAEKFPALTGITLAEDRSNDWMVIGLIRGGAFSGFSGQPTRPFSHAIERSSHSPELFAAMLTALVPRSSEWVHVTEASPYGSLRSVCADQLWDDVSSELPVGLARRMNMAFDAERLCAWRDEDDAPISDVDVGDPPLLEDYLHSVDDLAFLQAHGRAWSKLDRDLMRAIARNLAYAWSRQLPDDELDDRIRSYATFIVEELTEDERLAWAFHAMFRPGVQLDCSSDETLIQGFARYAVVQRRAMSLHLDSRGGFEREGTHDACRAASLPVFAPDVAIPVEVVPSR